MERLLERLGEAGCVPFLVVAEKRYVIAAKIVDTFLDPVDNPKAPAPFDEKVEARQETANALTALPEATLFEFAHAFRHRDPVGLASSLTNIIQSLQGEELVSLIPAFKEMQGRETELVEDLARLDADGPGNKTLNLPVFVDMLTNLELFARGSGSKNVTIVHDETLEFAHALEAAYKAFRDAVPAVLPLSNGNVLVTGYQSLRLLTFGNSKATSGIQVADLIAGAARVSATCALRNAPMCEEAAQLGAKLLAMALLPAPKLVSLIISDSFAERVVGPLVRRLVA